MADEFVKFPSTPHLVWLGEGRPRVDKLMSEADADRLLSHDLTVEEKVDGANVGISAGPGGVLRAQNRGAYLQKGAHPQFEPLWPWLAVRERILVEILGENLILFGEWCFAVHSKQYDRLPDWFLGFDVYDRAARAFWSVRKRGALLAETAIHAVPEIASGRFSREQLIRRLGRSLLSDGPMEGLYVRLDSGDWLQQRAKIVAKEFTQSIETHWTRAGLQKNRLATPKETC